MLCIFFSIFIQRSFAQTPQFGSEEELKKQAAQYFDDEEYAKGYKAYSQLVSNYPKDPNYNYRLGVCMLYSEPDKKKCYPYLEFANKNIKDCEKEAKFYLAKAYHSNFRFDEAIKLYTEYKDIASGGMAKKLHVDQEIQACKNGKRLLSNLNELVVLEKKQLAESEYFRSYNLKDIGGKLLVKPADYMTAADKKKKNKSIVYLPRSNDQLYYSSYGSGDNKDIYIVRKLPNGEWSKPQNMGAPINTEFDEDYPFLHPNGKVLYFASKGHNSMGGYDLFKSVFDEVTQTWGKPENLDFPINTPNDDILFVTDSLEKTAYFSSTRQSPYGKIDVFKINTERRAPEFIYIKGSVIKQNESMSVLARISIKDINAGENVGSFQAANDGNYLLKIPNGGKFIFTVETPGFPTQSEGIDIPASTSLLPYRQTITYKDKTLVITNFFKTNPGDENAYKDNLMIIEEKSKMDVNASDFTTPTTNTVAATNPKNTTGNPNSTGNPNTNTTGNPNTNSNLSNQQLEKIAFDDAKELQEDAVKLKSDANDAFTFENNQKIEADQKDKEALQAIENANKETDPVKKEQLLNKADDLKEDAQKLKDQARLAESIAQQLDKDANNKQKEADLQLKYAEQLKEVNKSKNNKEALTKLEAIQKELEQISNAPKNTDNLATSIKNEATRKDEEVKKLEPGLNKIKNDIADLNKEMSDVDKEINSTKDKSLLENLKTQKADLGEELKQKNADLSKTQDKINMLKKESEALNSQADFATNMLTEVKSSENVTPIAGNNSGNPNSNNTNITSPNSNTGTLPAIQKDQKTFDDASAILNKQPESSSRYTEQNKLIDTYISAIDKQLLGEKENLKKAKTPAEKTTVNNNIKELEALKKDKQEDKKINDSKIAYFKNIETNSTASNPTNTGNTNNTNTNSGNNATNNTGNNTQGNTATNNTGNTTQGNNTASIPDTPDLNTLNELDKIANSFSNPEEQALFNESTFGNPTAMNLKIKAEGEYNSAVADAKNTSDKINAAKVKLQNGDGAKNTEKINALNEEAAKLDAEATELRKQAKSHSGQAKQDDLKKAKELEAVSAGKKYEAAQLTSKDNENAYAQNEKIIDEYLKANKSGNSAVVTKVNMLVGEAKTMESQAMRLKEEANAEPDVAAKYSSYSNVEDKELLSLKKQEEAIALLKKNNPLFQPSVQNNNVVSESSIADIKNELNREEENKLKALEELAQANKQEYTFVMKRLKDNEAKPKGTNASIQQKEKEAVGLYNEANALLTKAGSSTNTKERAALLVDANKKLKAAIDKTNEAYNESKQLQAGGTVASNNTNNTGNSNNNTGNQNSGNNNTGQNPNSTGNNTGNGNNNTGNTASSGTVTPSTNKLTDAQIKSVQATPEYKNYTMLTQEVDKYESVADKESKKANTFYEQATQYLKESNDVRIQLDKLPPGNERNQKLEQAGNLDRLANQYKAKGDSVMELAANTKSFADSKKMEMEAYEQSLDPKTLENIRIASGKQPNSNTSGTANNNTNNTTSTPPSKYAEYSPEFRESATKFDENIKGFSNEQPTESNLNAQNTVLNNYNKAIDTEIANDKKKLSTANAADKTKINQRITALQNQKAANNQAIAGNTNKIKTLTPPTANNNTNNNNSGNNSNNNNSSGNNSSGNNTASNNTNNSGNNSSNNAGNNTNNSGNNTGNNNTGSAVTATGIAVKSGNAYSAANPIPIDDKLPPGIIFAVQIGAFKNPIPDDLFKGLSPLRGERTSTGFIRYQAGRFEKFDNANAVRNDLKKLGYKDAFVVVYKDGQRFSLAQAIQELKSQGIPVNNDPNESAGITINSNVPSANTVATTLNTNNANNNAPTANNTNTNTPTANNNPTPVVVNPTELNDMQGMLFTVQVGVYANQVNSGQLLNLKPIYRERLPNGQFRYTAGIYNNIDHVKTDRAKVNTLGIPDAFVSAYQNGQRIKISDALNQIASGANVQFPPENPIQFGDATSAPTNTVAPVTNTVTPTNPATNTTNTVTPFNNGITQGPQPTAENGVKVGDAGITFKVQIGAYKNQVPQNVASNFLKIKNWPILANQVNGLFIYTVGSYTEAKFARSLVDEARASGITDAFITVYKDGKKLYGAEASSYLNR